MFHLFLSFFFSSAYSTSKGSRIIAPEKNCPNPKTNPTYLFGFILQDLDCILEDRKWVKWYPARIRIYPAGLLKKYFRSAGKNSILQENIGILQDFTKAKWYPAGKVSILQVKN